MQPNRWRNRVKYVIALNQPFVVPGDVKQNGIIWRDVALADGRSQGGYGHGRRRPNRESLARLEETGCETGFLIRGRVGGSYRRA